MSIFSWFTNLFGHKTPTPIPTPVPAPTPVPVSKGSVRKGLLAGIDQYELPGNNLHGCVADSYDFNDVTSQKFAFTNKLLINDDATKSNILSELDDMISNANPGDELFYYQSSHGTQVNLPGSGKLDDVLVTHDFDWNDFKHIMTGAEIGAILAKLKPGVDMTVIVDACHSETATRGLNPHYRAKRCLIIPEHIKAQRNGLTFTRLKSFNRDIIPNQKYLLLSGCRDDQTSEELELNGSVRGIYTYTLTKYLRTDMTHPWSGIFAEVISDIARGGYEQIPQLNGSMYSNRRPFSGA